MTAEHQNRRGGGIWIFILLLLAIGAAAYLSGAGAKWLEDVRAWFDQVQPPATVKQAEKPATPPSFDVAYAQPTGQLVMAGRGEPGWTVKIESNGGAIGEAKVDGNGEWVFNPEQPLSPGQHSLSLSATSQSGERTLAGSQQIALSIDEKAGARPLLALTEANKPTRVLQGGERTADAGAVSFDAVDYETDGAGGRVLISGHAAPGGRVMVYINNGFAGVAVAGADGAWNFAGARDLPLGTHKIRADLVAAGADRVSSRAEVTFERTEGAGKTVAEAGARKAAPAHASEPRERAHRHKAAGTASGVKEASALGGLFGNDCGAVVVQRGDTLWAIAQRCYGDGARYTKIFRSNKTQIRDPDLIYPEQKLELP